MYTLVRSTRGNRIFIFRPDGTRVFNLKASDEDFANEILANLNAA